MREQCENFYHVVGGRQVSLLVNSTLGLMKTLKLLSRILFSILIVTLSTTTSAQSNVWQELLRVIQFSDVNRAQLEFNCRQNPQFSSVSHLKALCQKRRVLPDQVIESAALPYLKKHISESLAREAIVQLSSKSSRTVGRKLIVEIATGKKYQLTQGEQAFLEKQNQSEVGRALSAFATDREQGLAVARAMLEYQP